MKKIVIVTGAGGYIGSSLVPYLLKSGYKVRAIDRFFFGENFLPKHKDLQIIYDDIRNLKKKIFKNVHGIIDLAALSNDVTGQEYVKETFDINYKARLRNAKLAKECGVLRYILPSSCSNYGKIKTTEIANENYKLKPLTNYSKANSLAEKSIISLNTKNFVVTVLRQGTVYGYSPKMRFDLVINRMTYEAWKNKRLFLMKDGNQRRPTLHIKDAIKAMKFILNMESGLVNGEIFNVGCEGNNMKIKEIAKLINTFFDNKLKIEWYGSKDDRSYFVNFDKIREIGFKGKYKPIDGIKQLIKKLENKVIELEPHTLTLDWYKNLESWNDYLSKIKYNNKLIKF